MGRKLKNLMSAYLRKFKTLSNDPHVQEELRSVVQKGQRALELQLLQRNQSVIDKNQAQAAAALLSSMPDNSDAVLRIGSVLIAKRLSSSGRSQVLAEV